VRAIEAGSALLAVLTPSGAQQSVGKQQEGLGPRAWLGQLS
jgi:hypothetical protein